MIARCSLPVPVLIAGALLAGGCGDGKRAGEASNSVTQALSTVAAAPRTVTAPAQAKTVTAQVAYYETKTKTETVTKTVTAPAKTVTAEADSKVAPAAVGAAAGAIASDDTNTTTVVQTVTAAASPAPVAERPGGREPTMTDSDGLPAWLRCAAASRPPAPWASERSSGWRHRHHAPEPPPAA